jgi:hypothetical protein
MVAMMVIGGVVAALGLLFLKGRASALAKARQIGAVAGRTAGELAEMARTIAGQLGPGAYNEVVALRGTIECAAPLAAEISGTACVHYRTRVEREYEERYTEFDEARKEHVHKTRRARETVASATRGCPFVLRDATGTIDVLPDGATIDDEQTVSRFEPDPGPVAVGACLSLGGFTLTLGAPQGEGTRTLGYHLQEHVLPVGRDVYVLGQATDAEGRLAIHKPNTADAAFVISPRSREALLQSTASSAKGFYVAAIVCFVLGAGLIVGGLFAG